MKQDLSSALGRGRASIYGNTRQAGREQYYTPGGEAQRLVNTASLLIPNFTKRVGIDPAAGRGAFFTEMKRHGLPLVLGYDIMPLCDGVQEADFLSLDLPPEVKNAVSLTNPPFGRNSSLSVPFFNALAPHCDYIGFIVPRSWRKWTLQARLDRHFHLLHDEDLSLHFENERGEALASGPKRLQTVFQLWEKRVEERPVIPIPHHGLFERTSPARADLAVRVRGHNCGTVLETFERKPNTTLLFLKVLDPLALDALRGADLARFYNNVAHVETLSLDELNFAVSEWLTMRASL